MHPILKNLEVIVERLENNGHSAIVIKNFLKEFLQDDILNLIYGSDLTKQLIFYGGTCLRKLYGLNRLSEDLDFEVVEPFDIEVVEKVAESYFGSIGFSGVDMKMQKSSSISRLTFKFSILNQLGLSSYDNEKLHVKVEINDNTEIDYPIEKTPYLKNQFSVMIKHYSLPVLMSGKILAALTREYQKGDSGILVKGRDFYDLIWYMQQGIKPNQKKLKDFNSDYSLDYVFKLLDDKIENISAGDLLVDLQPFFEDQNFIYSWCHNFANLYKRYRVNY